MDLPQKRENKIGTPTVGLRKEKLQFGLYNILALPETLKFPFLTTIRALNHWSTDKIKAFMNQFWGENINKAAKIAYFTCPKYNPGKPVCTAPRHFKLPDGPFEIWQMGFIHLPSSKEYKCAFCHALYVFTGPKDFSNRQSINCLFCGQSPFEVITQGTQTGAL